MSAIASVQSKGNELIQVVRFSSVVSLLILTFPPVLLDRAKSIAECDSNRIKEDSEQISFIS